MSRTCDQCGHDVPTYGGEGRFSIHDLNGNVEAPFRARLPKGAVQCPGSLLHPVDDDGGRSVHTTSGGLPGLGKRR